MSIGYGTWRTSESPFCFRCRHRRLRRSGDNGDKIDRKLPPRYAPRGPLGVRKIAPTEPDTPLSSILTYAFIAPSVAMLRRRVYEAVGGWRPEIGQYYEDADLFMLMRLEAGVHFIPERLVDYRWHAGEASASADREAAQRQQLLDRWADRQSNRQVKAAFAFLERQYAWKTACAAARARLHDGRRIDGARFLLGGARNIARSYLR